MRSNLTARRSRLGTPVPAVGAGVPTTMRRGALWALQCPLWALECARHPSSMCRGSIQRVRWARRRGVPRVRPARPPFQRPGHPTKPGRRPPSLLPSAAPATAGHAPRRGDVWQANPIRQPLVAAANAQWVSQELTRNARSNPAAKLHNRVAEFYITESVKHYSNVGIRFARKRKACSSPPRLRVR